MVNVTLCPARSASGIYKTRRRAVYGMGATLATIAPAHQTTKGPVKIMQATWNYKPGHVTLVKAKG